jgi:DNA-binding LacI/PurR family transcriptional regulator
LYQSSPDGIHLPSVRVENLSGTRRLMDHLIEAHHRRRILLLRGPKSHEDSFWREQGYRDSLEAHNMPFDSSLVTDGSFNHEVSHYFTGQAIQEGVEFDAVFAGDDDAALGVLLALQEANLRVPEDVAVVGFDDQSFSSTLLPPLTTVHSPVQEIGQRAVEMLIQLINGEELPSPELILPTELIVRQSCGCKATFK